MLDFIGKGDVLLMTRVHRLARSIADLQDIVRTLKAKGAALVPRLPREQTERVPVRKVTAK